MEISNRKSGIKLTKILFAIYIIALFWIIVLKLNIGTHPLKTMRTVNLIPYGDPLILNGQLDYSEIIMNIVIFMPLGIYSGVLFKRWSSGKKILLYFLISLTCEVLQFVFSIGATDITDLINNTMGGIIGLLMYKGIKKILKNGDKAERFINIMATIVTSLIVLLFLLLVINNLWLFRS